MQIFRSQKIVNIILTICKISVDKFDEKNMKNMNKVNSQKTDK